MEYSEKKLKKFYIISLAKALLLLLFSVGIIYVFYNEIDKEVNLLYEERTLSANISMREETINALKENYKIVEQDVLNMKEIIPVSGAKLFEVLRTLRSLGDYSVKQVSITFSEASNITGYDEIIFDIYAQGTVSEIIEYIKLLESLPYGIKFVSYDITGQGGVANNSELRLQAKMLFMKK